MNFIIGAFIFSVDLPLHYFQFKVFVCFCLVHFVCLRLVHFFYFTHLFADQVKPLFDVVIVDVTINDFVFQLSICHLSQDIWTCNSAKTYFL